MSLKWIAILGVLLFAGVSPSLAQMTGYYPKGGADYGPVDVSLVQLIANPAAYNHKRVRLIGYLHLEFEGSAVYLHRDDYEVGISRNGVWINAPHDLTKEQRDTVNDHYVICTAEFDADHQGHMGMFSGELTNVTRIEIWPWEKLRELVTQKPASPAPK